MGTTARDLGLTSDLVRLGLERLRAQRKVIIDSQERVCLAETHNAEVYVARRLMALHRQALTSQVETYAEAFGAITPDPAQAEAVDLLTTAPVGILTGGPGVGKTATLKAVLATLEKGGVSTMCCAPTGMAADRMREQTGRPASTMHRAMREHLDEDGNPMRFSAGAIVVDELSMVDVRLFADFLRHVRQGHRLLLVGDPDQLPSIGAGRLLWDLLRAGIFPVARLTKIFRQASESSIPYIAAAINRGEAPRLDVGYPDFYWVEQADPDYVGQWCVEAVAVQAMQVLGVPATDVQVIAPQKSKGCGVEALNAQLQQRLNPVASNEGDVRIGGGYTCRVGDRVMHTESNDYERMVFNGSKGLVVAADPAGLPGAVVYELCAQSTPDAVSDLARSDRASKVVLVVDFGGRNIPYTRDQAGDLLLSYCITVHKAQGSQAPVIVIPVHSVHGSMLTRNLLYTAITRATRAVICIGQAGQLRKSAANSRGAERRTLLQEALRLAESAPAERSDGSSLAGVAALDADGNATDGNATDGGATDGE